MYVFVLFLKSLMLIKALKTEILIFLIHFKIGTI